MERVASHVKVSPRNDGQVAHAASASTPGQQLMNQSDAHRIGSPWVGRQEQAREKKRKQRQVKTLFT
jgi:hypothetical protein